MSFERVFPSVLGTYTPDAPKRKSVPARGYDLERKPRSLTLLTDHQVLEARWLVEFGGWSHGMAAMHFGISRVYARSLFKYQTRSKIFPKQDDFPCGHRPSAA